MKIPVGRITNTDYFDLKSSIMQVGAVKVYLRMMAGRGPESTVNVQLCAEASDTVWHRFRHLSVEIDPVNYNFGNSRHMERRIGGPEPEGDWTLQVWNTTKMTELDDGSGDEGFGGSLRVHRYTSREAYDGDGEPTTDGPGSAAELAGVAAG